MGLARQGGYKREAKHILIKCEVCKGKKGRLFTYKGKSTCSSCIRKNTGMNIEEFRKWVKSKRK